MSLYAIGDLHLSFTANKPMDVFGREWKDHVRKIEKNWRGRIGAEDTVVITGDHPGDGIWRRPWLIWISSSPCRDEKSC